MKHTRVVVLDLAPGDVLVLRTEDPFDIEDVRILCTKFEDLYKVKTLIIDSSVDMERFSRKRITAIRAMFSDPRFRRSMEQVSDVVNQISPTARKMAATRKQRLCGWWSCGRPLDALDRCKVHGNAWAIKNAAAYADAIKNAAVKRETDK